MKRFRLLTVIAGVSIIVTIVTLHIFKFSPLELIENKLLDFRFKIRGTRQHSGRTVIVGIDDLSLSNYGRWPWKRETIAELLEKVFEYKPKVVGVDIFFSEEDNITPLKSVVEKYKENMVLPVVFITPYPDIIKRYKASIPKIKGLPSPVDIVRIHTGGDILTFSAKSVLPLTQSLQELSLHSGSITLFPDPDGVLRKEIIILNYKGRFYPSFPLQMVKHFSGIKSPLIYIPAYELKAGNLEIPLNEWGCILINWYGPQYSFPYVSASEVLENRLPEELLKNKIVLIGLTATGTHDLRPTPFSPLFPMVEKNATVIENILNKDYIYSGEWVKLFETALIIGLGILALLFSLNLIPLYSFLVNSSLLILYIIFNQIVFNETGLLLNLLYPSLSILTIYGIVTAIRLGTEEKMRREIKKAFEYYHSEELLREIIAKPQFLNFGGERKEMSVLFCDIRDFTEFAEKNLPETVVERLGDLFTNIVEVIWQFHGTIDKFIGDAVMCFWGAPLPCFDHPVKACETALTILEVLKKHNEKWKMKGAPPFKIGIGIETGEAIIGNFGSKQRFDYTVIGNVPNMASRFQELSKELEGDIIVGEKTYNSTKDRFIYEEKRGIKIRGREEPVKIYILKSKNC